ncbi:hypothetical protein BGX27_006855, partial [Mortierella sp. AM989]
LPHIYGCQSAQRTLRGFCHGFLKPRDIRTCTRQVAGWLNISQRSAANILSVNKGNHVINKGGRPRKLTTKDAQIARLDLKRGRAKSAVQATKRLNETLAAKISVQTVRQALREIGMNAKKTVRRPALKKQHKAARK